MNMAHFVKRFPRTRSSKRYCKEKFACQNEKSEAEYECESCGTVQCAACERKLHSVSKYMHHDRVKLTAVPKELLCEYSCVDANYADLVCTNCNLRYCDQCFVKAHAHSSKKHHQKVKFVYRSTSDASAQDKLVNAISDTHYDAIQPTSPLSFGADDSLTYFSMPQAVSNNFEDGSNNERNQDNDLKYSMSDNINLFAEDPSFHDAVSTDPCLADLSLNGLEFRNNHMALNEKEDSEPESSRPSSVNEDDEIFEKCRSFPLADQNESLQVGSVDDFIKKLGCDDYIKVKVISIFGNTGDGKSHTLNYTFFGGREIFKTSPSPQSCTTGVWAAFDPVHEAIIIDTEGLLGVSPNQNQRTRLLLKVLALSDIVIYRSRAERLHNDLFQFLADASKAYVKHFSEELKAASARFGENLTVSELGPVVLVFHETQHTEVLGKNSSESPDELLRKRFHDLEFSIEAFSSLHYIGTQTVKPPTDFRGLLLTVKNKLRDSSVRSARKPSVIYNTLQILNQKFSGEIEKSLPETFPDQYFTCRSHCLSCNAKCSMSMNHLRDSIPHHNDKRCSYRFEYENKIFLCKVGNGFLYL